MKKIRKHLSTLIGLNVLILFVLGFLVKGSECGYDHYSFLHPLGGTPEPGKMYPMLCIGVPFSPWIFLASDILFVLIILYTIIYFVSRSKTKQPS